MRHEIYATTFYGPLCLFGKNIFIRKLHERRKRPILSEMYECWFVFYDERCHFNFWQYNSFHMYLEIRLQIV